MAKKYKHSTPGMRGMPAFLEINELGDFLAPVCNPQTGEMPASVLDWPPYMVTPTTLAEAANVSLTTIQNWMKRPAFPERDSDGLINLWEVVVWKGNRDEGLKHRCHHCGRPQAN